MSALHLFHYHLMTSTASPYRTAAVLATVKRRERLDVPNGLADTRG
jgi:hypothetical protein